MNGKKKHAYKISTEYIIKYDTLLVHPINRYIHVTHRIKLLIHNIEYDNKILMRLRFKKYGQIQKIPRREIPMVIVDPEIYYVGHTTDITKSFKFYKQYSLIKC